MSARPAHDRLRMTPRFERLDHEETSTTWDAAVLAGGRSRRLGGCDKLRLPVGGARVIDRLVTAIRPLVGELVLVTRGEGAHRDLEIPTVPDRLPGCGVLAGIDAALAATTASHLLVVACDMPFLTRAFLAGLLQAGRDVDVAVPRAADGRAPVCASVARTCHATVQQFLEAGHWSFRDFLGAVRLRALAPDEIRRYDPDGVLLLNVNTPFDYARALAACQQDRQASYPHGRP